MEYLESLVPLVFYLVLDLYHCCTIRRLILSLKACFKCFAHIKTTMQKLVEADGRTAGYNMQLPKSQEQTKSQLLGFCKSSVSKKAFPLGWE